MRKNFLKKCIKNIRNNRVIKKNAGMCNPYMEILMAKRHKGIKVCGNQIEVAGHTYADEKLRPYDREKVDVAELSETLIVYDRDGCLISSLDKNLLKDQIQKAIEKYGIPNEVVLDGSLIIEIPKVMEKALEFHLEQAKKQMKIDNERISAIQRVNQDTIA